MENVNVGDTVFVHLPFFEIIGHFPVVAIGEDGSVVVNHPEVNVSVIPECFTLVERAGKPDNGQLELFVSEG